MNWTDLLPYATLLTAVLVLLGVVFTAGVQSRIAKHNRESAEAQAEAKLEHDRLITAQERLFEPRAKVYLDAVGLLTRLNETGYRNVFIGEEYAPGWKEEFSPSVERDLSTRLRIYGTPEAVALFQRAWRSLLEATRGKDTAHTLFKQLEAEKKGSVAKTGLHETRIRVEKEANRNYKDGYEAFEQFSRICQSDLGGGKSDGW